MFVNLWPSRSASAAAPSAPASPRLELGVDVVNGVSDSAQVFKVFIIDTEPDGPLPQLLFQALHQLYERQGVRIEVLDERCALGDRRRVSLQNVSQLVPDQREHPVTVKGALVGVGFGRHMHSWSWFEEFRTEAMLPVFGPRPPG